MLPDIPIETDRLRLRPFDLHDLDQIAVICSDPEVMAHLPEGILSRAETQEILQWLQSCYAENTPQHIVKLTLAVEDEATGRVTGWCGLGPLDFDESQIEVFCGFAREFQGRGFATEACLAMLRYGLVTLGLPRIVAVVDEANQPSQRLIRRLGMTYRYRVTGLPAAHSCYDNHLYYVQAGVADPGEASGKNS